MVAVRSVQYHVLNKHLVGRPVCSYDNIVDCSFVECQPREYKTFEIPHNILPWFDHLQLPAQFFASL